MPLTNVSGGLSLTSALHTTYIVEHLHFRYLKMFGDPNPQEMFSTSPFHPNFWLKSSPGTVMRCAMSGSPALGAWDSYQRQPTWFKGEATVRNAG